MANRKIQKRKAKAILMNLAALPDFYEMFDV
jgi:hypothetical protein